MTESESNNATDLHAQRGGASLTENQVGPPPFLVRRRTVFTWLVPLLLAAGVLTLRRFGDFGGLTSLGIGIGLVVLGEIVRFWAAGYISKDELVTTGGPYGHVRNPLYFGSLLLAFGYGLVSGLGWPVVVLLVVLFLVFHLAAIRYEESFLKAKFGTPYHEYLSRVPRLIPSPWPRTRGEGSFAWAQALRNREHISAMFAVVFVVILTICRYMGR
ncbi:MAG: methyltransferase family protein [Capsulimonadaceae bacterium]